MLIPVGTSYDSSESLLLWSMLVMQELGASGSYRSVGSIPTFTVLVCSYHFRGILGTNHYLKPLILPALNLVGLISSFTENYILTFAFNYPT